MVFKSISNITQKMVVSLDLIEMRDSETGKKRSMISLNLWPESEKTDDGN